MTHPTWGDILRAARTAKGWSQGDVERATGISRVTVSKQETGKQQPDKVTLLPLCRALGLDPLAALAALYDLPGRPQQPPDPPELARLAAQYADQDLTDTDRMTMRASLRMVIEWADAKIAATHARRPRRTA